MSPLTFVLANAPMRSLDLGNINPSALAGRSLSAIRRLRLAQGRGTVALGDLFDISGDDAETLRFRGLTASCHRLGQGMSAGVVEVHGEVGAELGREMRGGRIQVSGSSGDGVGAGMRGGAIVIGKNAGDGVGGITPGATRGMNGGVIVIGGNAGSLSGERMRRGLILIGGNVGAHCGNRMIAGTIVVFGECGANAGLGMRRGSLLLARAPRNMTATFNDCGEHELGFLPLLVHYVDEHSRAHARKLASFQRVRRWAGDMAYGGKGEVFIAAP